jgi:hypothetical protein
MRIVLFTERNSPFGNEFPRRIYRHRHASSVKPKQNVRRRLRRQSETRSRQVARFLFRRMASMFLICHVERHCEDEDKHRRPVFYD